MYRCEGGLILSELIIEGDRVLIKILWIKLKWFDYMKNKFRIFSRYDDIKR